MGKVFDSEAVMKALRRTLEILDEVTETDHKMARNALNIVRFARLQRQHDFTRGQLWELDQMESCMEQKIHRMHALEGESLYTDRGTDK